MKQSQRDLQYQRLISSINSGSFSKLIYPLPKGLKVQAKKPVDKPVSNKRLKDKHKLADASPQIVNQNSNSKDETDQEGDTQEESKVGDNPEAH